MTSHTTPQPKPPAAAIARHAALVDVHLDAVDATARREAGAGVTDLVHEDREQFERLHDGVDAPRPEDEHSVGADRHYDIDLVGVAAERPHSYLY